MNWHMHKSWIVLAGISAGVLNSAAVGDEWNDPGWTSPPADVEDGPEVRGVWHELMEWPVEAIHAIHLPPKPTPGVSLDPPMGKILIFDSGDGPPPHLWNPENETLTPTDPLKSDIFCAGHAHLFDGTPLIAGGDYIPDGNLFDFVSEQWIPIDDMAYSRFYPTCTTLPSGNILVTSGAQSGYQFAGIPEIYDDEAKQWYSLPPSAYMPFESLYPLQFLLPDGPVATVGATEGEETTTYWLDLDTNEWIKVAENFFPAGSAAMYLPGQVLAAGGAGNATVEAAVINFNAGLLPVMPVWEEVGRMHHARTNHDLTILADGTVLAVGGPNDVFEAELWVPTLGTWQLLAATEEPRGYHSTTILMSDGRVLAAGGREDHTAEIYSPPYLFWGPRPNLASAPAVVGYDQAFEVKTPNAADIARVALVGLGSVTHSNDMNQRYVPLKFSPGFNSLKVRSPEHANIAPRGVYMLFILSSKGVPSYARYVRLD